MWNEGQRGAEEDGLGRSSTSSDVVVMDEAVAAVSNGIPSVSNLNITKSSRVHIGPKFVSVTQNVSNTEMVKDLPFHQYIWNVMKNTSRAERFSCGIALAALLLCTLLIIYFTVLAKTTPSDNLDKAPHEWNISRSMWLAAPFESYTKFDISQLPLKVVLIQHTVSTECHKFILCAAELRTLEQYFLRQEFPNTIPYNFVIGNDGRVYESLGWENVGAHTRGYNLCSLGVGFIGDYRKEKNIHTEVTAKQMERFKMLLEAGVKYGYLHPNYRIVAAMDVQSTASPGSGLYEELFKMDHFDHQHFFVNKTCDYIRDMHLPPVK